MELQTLSQLFEMDVDILYRIFVMKVSEESNENNLSIYNKIRFGINVQFDFEDIINGNIDGFDDNNYLCYKKKKESNYSGKRIYEIRCVKIGKTRFDYKEINKIRREVEDRKRLIIKWLMNNWEKVGFDVENRAGGTQ